MLYEVITIHQKVDTRHAGTSQFAERGECIFLNFVGLCGRDGRRNQAFGATHSFRTATFSTPFRVITSYSIHYTKLYELIHDDQIRFQLIQAYLCKYLAQFIKQGS